MVVVVVVLDAMLLVLPIIVSSCLVSTWRYLCRPHTYAPFVSCQGETMAPTREHERMAQRRWERARISRMVPSDKIRSSLDKTWDDILEVAEQYKKTVNSPLPTYITEAQGNAYRTDYFSRFGPNFLFLGILYYEDLEFVKKYLDAVLMFALSVQCYHLLLRNHNMINV